MPWHGHRARRPHRGQRSPRCHGRSRTSHFEHQRQNEHRASGSRSRHGRGHQMHCAAEQLGRAAQHPPENVEPAHGRKRLPRVFRDRDLGLHGGHRRVGCVLIRLRRHQCARRPLGPLQTRCPSDGGAFDIEVVGRPQHALPAALPLWSTWTTCQRQALHHRHVGCLHHADGDGSARPRPLLGGHTLGGDPARAVPNLAQPGPRPDHPSRQPGCRPPGHTDRPRRQRERHDLADRRDARRCASLDRLRSGSPVGLLLGHGGLPKAHLGADGPGGAVAHKVGLA
mmetsp:Transcript_118837/g.379131  ORF Transcript_118837/g.379131 Transcript_118837/m.379131 type:complete len:283 (+) Transcript_118837:1776-2624(+)